MDNFKQAIVDCGIQPDENANTVGDLMKQWKRDLDEETREDEEEQYTCHLKDFESCKHIMNDANVYYPHSSYFPRGEEGHFYIVLPSEKVSCKSLEKEYWTPQWTQETYQCDFKIGKSNCLMSRLSYYPPFTRLMYSWHCPSRLSQFEYRMKVMLHDDNRFIRKTKTRNGEFFEGNLSLAYKLIDAVYKEMFIDACLDEN